MSRTNDTRVVSYQPLVAPHDLLAELPMGPERTALVEEARAEVQAVLDGEDDRLLVVVGPCSVHDPRGRLDYARRLAGAGRRARRRSVRRDAGVLREAAHDRGLEGPDQRPGPGRQLRRQRGLRTGAQAAARHRLDLGLPAGCEFLDPITPQYIADAVTWGAIGARTTESQVHRQLASGLSMPVGFKNGTDGDVQVAVDALRAAAQPHTLLRRRPSRGSPRS